MSRARMLFLLRRFDLTEHATEADLKRAYFLQAKSAHPDTNAATPVASFVDLKRDYEEARGLLIRRMRFDPRLMPPRNARYGAMNYGFVKENIYDSRENQYGYSDDYVSQELPYCSLWKKVLTSIALVGLSGATLYTLHITNGRVCKFPPGREELAAAATRHHEPTQMFSAVKTPLAENSDWYRDRTKRAPAVRRRNRTAKKKYSSGKGYL